MVNRNRGTKEGGKGKGETKDEVKKRKEGKGGK